MSLVLAIIPARLASTRLPRKVLLNKTGKPLVQHVYEGAKACKLFDKVVVATDAQEVADVVNGFGGEAVMTSPDCASGTDRVAEAARKYPNATLVVNVQGDEPEMDPRPLTALVKGMLANPKARMGTIAVPWPKGVPINEPGFVKVVTDNEGYALYFSRSPIPFYREHGNLAPDVPLDDGSPRYVKHVGLYAFEPKFLQEYAKLAPTALEKAESLEQLRALQNGVRIAVFMSEYQGYEVNTPADYEAFVARQAGRKT
ncbi:MAG: 3-deoxy-manno-octulosonate cytidylyltransferase [Planctomycetes bacterium]|nr:3-deoxy-manno-octulosonate cytidylyltransferase [Planctomycetota bacterium]